MRKILSLLIAIALVLPSASFAADSGSGSLTTTGKRAKLVGKSALYGFGGGLVVGVASQAFKKKTKNVFLFGSLGLYAGIALGIYVISTSKPSAPYEGPDTYEDFGDYSRTTAPISTGLMAAKRDPFAGEAISMDVLKVKF